MLSRKRPQRLRRHRNPASWRRSACGTTLKSACFHFTAQLKTIYYNKIYTFRKLAIMTERKKSETSNEL